ncbi:MAG: hypothetical protein WCJ03_07145 [Bacteroidales bacterium]
MTTTSDDDSKTIKIVMLGHSRVGKTTYMASLYGAMQQQRNGFKLKAPSNDDHQRLLNLSQIIAKGNYPLGTDQRKEYMFSLLHNDEEVFEFKWADYRGEAILLSGKTEEQARKLQEDLKYADGLILFCDSEALSRGDTQANQLGRLNSLIHHAVRDIETPMALAVVLTKSDMISAYTRPMIDHFSGLISAVNASEMVNGAFIPTACGVSSINVHVPLLYALHVMVYIKALYLNQLRERFEEEKRTRDEGRGVGDWIFSKMFGLPTDGELYELAKAKLYELEKIIEPTNESLKSLASSLEEFPLIDKDKSLDDYVEQLTAVRKLSSGNLLKRKSPWELY